MVIQRGPLVLLSAPGIIRVSTSCTLTHAFLKSLPLHRNINSNKSNTQRRCLRPSLPCRIRSRTKNNITYMPRTSYNSFSQNRKLADRWITRTFHFGCTFISGMSMGQAYWYSLLAHPSFSMQNTAHSPAAAWFSSENMPTRRSSFQARVTMSTPLQ